jgi:hypothetical protein
MGIAIAVENEIIFAEGDICNEMSFLVEGKYDYHCDEDVLENTPRPSNRPRHPRHKAGKDLLSEGDVACEVALWTTWEHQGMLVSALDSLLITLDAGTFSREIIAHHRATTHVVKYAKHFCWRMERAPAVCDLIGFDLDLTTIDQDLFMGGPEDHLGFISHFKLEAGTEATLLKDEIESLIKSDRSNKAGDFQSPIFVDSEDLVDLTKLIDHVRGSRCLILLLTPGVLTRPWCLLEIVAAKRFGRPFVPIQLVHPGLKDFVYPDEDFFDRLHREKIIANGAHGRRCRTYSSDA